MNDVRKTWVNLQVWILEIQKLIVSLKPSFEGVWTPPLGADWASNQMSVRYRR